MSNRRPPSRSSRGSTAPKRPSSQGRPRTRRPSAEKPSATTRLGRIDGATVRAQLDDLASHRRDIVLEGIEGTRRVSARALVILLSAAAAIVLLMPTMSRYMDQQRSLRSAQAELERVLDHNAELERQLDLWNDEDYVKAQARHRLGYVMPGETLYVITDSEEGSAAERLEARTRQLQRQRRANTPWYVTMWDSVQAAGRVAEDGTVDNPDAAPMLNDATPAATESSGPSASASPSPSESASAAESGAAGTQASRDARVNTEDTDEDDASGSKRSGNEPSRAGASETETRGAAKAKDN